MTDLRTAAQQALEALQNCANGEDDVLLTRDALAALRAALAEPQEPDSPERRCGGPGCDLKCCQPVQEPDDKAASIRWQLCLLAQTEEFSDEVRNQIGRGVWLIDRLTEAAQAEPVLQTCNCRWDGETQVQQCTLHEAHVDAIHEWAERAKTAEKKLAAVKEPVQEQAKSDHETRAEIAEQQVVQLAEERDHYLNLWLKAKQAEPAQEPVQEPVAWRTFDGEGGYDYRTYEDNEDYAAEWAKRNPRHVGWVEPLYTAPPQNKENT